MDAAIAQNGGAAAKHFGKAPKRMCSSMTAKLGTSTR
jgi:hypothetical protein